MENFKPWQRCTVWTRVWMFRALGQRISWRAVVTPVSLFSAGEECCGSFRVRTLQTVHDLIAVPPPRQLGEMELKAERSILKRELRRFAEFADSALNTQSAYEVIWDLADQYDVLDF